MQNNFDRCHFVHYKTKIWKIQLLGACVQYLNYYLYSRASFDYRRALLHFTCIAFISTSGAAPTIITVPRLIAAGLLMLRRSLIEFWIFEPFGRHVARDSALCNNTMIGFALTVHQVETFRVPAQIRLHQCKEQTSCSLAGLRHKIFLKF